MTHMAWVPERWEDAATRTLGGLEERHPVADDPALPASGRGPGRARRRDRPALLRRRPERRLRLLRGDRSSTCAGRARTHPGDGRRAAPRHRPARLPALARRARRSASTELEELIGEADRLIVDSTEWERPDADLARLAELFDVIAVVGHRVGADRAVALRARRAAGRRSRASRTLRVDGPGRTALLLAGWLRARLGRDDRARARGRRRARGGGRRRRNGRPGHGGPSRRATCSPTSSTSSAATASTRRRYGASPRSRPSRARRRAGSRRGPRAATRSDRARRRLDARARLRAAGRAGPRLGGLARLVERRAARPARPSRLERGHGAPGAPRPRPDPGGADPPAPVDRRRALPTSST